MAVGTGAISLTEVEAEIAGVQTSLSGCIGAANAGGFDPTYYTAPATSLAEFRGYSDICVAGLTGFTFYPTATGDSTTACGPVGGSTTHYHDGAGSRPATSDIIYTSSDGCTVFNGGGSWFSDYNGLTRNRYQVSSSGVVSNHGVC